MKAPFKIGVGVKVNALFALGVVAAALASGLLLFFRYVESIDERVNDRLRAGAYAVAAALDPAQVAALNASGDRSDAYRDGWRRLRRLKEALDLTYLYLIVRDEQGDYVFTYDTGDDPDVIAYPQGDAYRYEWGDWVPRERRIGEATQDDRDTHWRKYEQVPVEVPAAFDSGQPGIIPEYTDEFGTFRSYFYPIEHEGRVIALVGADLDVSQIGRSRIEALGLLGIGAVISVIIMLAASALIRRIVISPLRKLKRATSAAAEGDLRAIELATSGDEIGELAEDFSAMLARWSAVVQDIKSAANRLLERAAALRAGAIALNAGAEMQIGAASDVSAAVAELAAGSARSSANADSAQRAAEATAAETRSGAEAVRETLQAMRDIAARNAVVEEIAAETHLLSVNAAIEAARAGGEGGGFIVVAEEIRKLAAACARAAQEISALSDGGISIAERAAAALDDVLPGIDRNVRHVQEIARSSAEQLEAAEAIRSAVSRLEQVISVNTAYSREVRGVQTEIIGSISELKNALAYFRDGAAPGDEARSER